MKNIFSICLNHFTDNFYLLFENKIFRLTFKLLTYLIINTIKGLVTYLLLGILFPLVFQKLDTKSSLNFLDLSIWKRYWLYLILLLICRLFIFIYEKLYVSFKFKKAYSVQVAMTHVYKSLDFEVIDDVRMTIWSPRLFKDDIPKMAYQLTDYYPLLSKPDGKITIVNAKSGRFRRIISKIGNEITPVGVIGKCANDSIVYHKTKHVFGHIQEDDDFDEWMKVNMDFSKQLIKTLRKDRTSFYAVAIMDKTETSILGILYCDAKSRNFFSAKMMEKIEALIPYISNFLDQ